MKRYMLYISSAVLLGVLCLVIVLQGDAKSSTGANPDKSCTLNGGLSTCTIKITQTAHSAFVAYGKTSSASNLHIWVSCGSSQFLQHTYEAYDRFSVVLGPNANTAFGLQAWKLMKGKACTVIATAQGMPRIELHVSWNGQIYDVATGSSKPCISEHSPGHFHALCAIRNPESYHIQAMATQPYKVSWMLACYGAPSAEATSGASSASTLSSHDVVANGIIRLNPSAEEKRMMMRWPLCELDVTFTRVRPEVAHHLAGVITFGNLPRAVIHDNTRAGQ